MTIFAYPLFLFIFIFLLTRRYEQMTLLQGVARWLLAIALAYIATFALSAALIPVIGLQYFYGDSSLLQLYWQPVDAALGLSLILMALGLVLLGGSRFWQSAKRGSFAVQTGESSFKRATWVFTALIVVSLVLVLFLLIEPYFFSLKRLGNPVYELSLWVWAFAAFFLTPIALIQVSVLKRIWSKLYLVEKIVHISATTASILTTLFVLTIGTAILNWLLE